MMRQDIAYALRGLLRRPVFTSVAVLTLALGIGANAAIFSVVNAVLLRPLPYPSPDRLMMVWTHNPRQGFEKDVSTYPNFDDWRRENRSFERLAAYTGGSYTLTGAGEPTQIRGAVVTPGFFETLGLPAARGRVFGDTEGRAGSDRAVVLAHGLWKRRFSSDHAIVGKTVLLNGVSHEVLGVMPEGFAYPEDADLWTPLAPSERFAELMQARGAFWLTVIGRLRPGVPRPAAQSEMDGIASRLERQYPANEGLGIRLVPMHEEIVGEVQRPLLILLGAVCFVLLIACANVANLLLTRAASRQKELAIRAALGAGRARLVRQMLTESLLLALVGGGVGLLLAAWGVDLLQTMAPTNVPRLALVAVDPAVLAYTVSASLITGLAFGLVPAFQGTSSAGESLKEGGRTGSEGSGGRRLRSALAVLEIATALVLLIGAGLLVRSFIAMNRVDLGFEARQVLALGLELPRARYPQGPQVTAFYEQLAARLSGLPGVESTAAGSSLLLSSLPQSAGLQVEGRPPAAGDGANVPVPYDAVTPDFFRTLRIPLIAGRLFTAADGPTALRVVVVNQAFVRRYFPDTNPIGRRVTFGDSTDSNTSWLTIVGVVADTRRGGLHRPQPWAELYYPHAQAPDRRMFVLLRTAGDPMNLARAAQAEVWSIDRDQPVSSVRTVEAIVARAHANRRFTTLLLGLFAAVALVLAGIGVYGVIAYSTAQRTQEIGIRMALGAGRSHVLRMVVGEGLRIGAAGLLLGIAVSLALTRLMSGLLFGVSARDPLTFVALPVMLLAVAMAASWIPARRAVRVDPMIALRGE
jgi:putative ABC transport system permease protein